MMSGTHSSLTKNLVGLPVSVQLSKPQGPGVDNKTCAGLWGKEGTLCNLTLLIDFDQKRTQQVQNSVTSYNLLIDNLSHIAKMAKKLTALKASTKSTFDDLVTSDFSSISKENADTCMKQLIKSRSSSLCYRCSQAYDRYQLSIVREQKFIVPEDFCSKMMTACEPHLEDLATLGKLYFEKPSTMGELSKVYQIQLQTMATHQQILQLALFSGLLIEWKSANVDLKASLSNKVCSMAIGLEKAPLLSSFSRLLGKPTSELLAKIEQEYDQTAVSRRLGPSDILSLHRSLVETDSEHFQLPGDVAVLKATDNMFTSFDGVQGSPLSVENTGNAKAMNMSVCFP